MTLFDELSIGVNPTLDGPAGRGFRRGYTTPSSARASIAAAHATRLWLSVTLALADNAIVVAVIAACAWPPLWRGWDIVAGLAAGVFAALVTGRQFRALENLAHEASHFNWSRRHRRVNDLLARSLATAATGVRLNVYVASHRRHHGSFGTREDPDFATYQRLGLEELDRSSARAFAASVLGKMTLYRRQWRDASAGQRKPPLTPVLWAAVVIVLPAGLLWWRVPSALVAIGIWLAGFYVVLPVIRFIGESSEHIYTGQNTVFDATISNLGLVQRILIHPHGDGYHTLHHLWPGVPHHQIRKLHRLLVSADEAYAARLRYRTRVLSAPGRGLPPGMVRAKAKQYGYVT